jgi:hypothetical protein
MNPIQSELLGARGLCASPKYSTGESQSQIRCALILFHASERLFFKIPNQFKCRYILIIIMVKSIRHVPRLISLEETCPVKLDIGLDIDTLYYIKRDDLYNV